MTISDALSRLRLQPTEFERNLLSKPVSLSLYKPFIDTPARLRERLERPISVRTLLDHQAVLGRWQAAGFSLSGLNLAEIKCLCVSSETATLPQLVGSLAGDPRLPKKATWLMGLVGAYCTKWSTITERLKLEALLRQSFGAYVGTNGGLRKLKQVAPNVFAPTASRFVADAAVAGLCSVELVLKSLSLPTTGDLAIQARATLATSWMERFKSAATDNDAQSLLNYLLRDVFANASPSPEFYQAIDLATRSRHANNSEAFRETLQKYALSSKNLGDPRLPANRANWAPIPLASQVVLSWLARESLLFFFDMILPNSHENRQRKEFWLRYYKSIRDFQVAISEKDLTRLRARVRDLPGYSKIDHPTTSAFLMKFVGTPEILIVEFSETGNAAYVHNAKTFVAEVADLRQYKFFLRDELKHKSRMDKILHLPVNSWQWKAASMLAMWGVRP